MPKIENEVQDFVFGLLMVAVMAIFMVTYNVSINMGGFSGEVVPVVAKAIWWPMVIAFVIENLFVGKAAKRIAFKLVNPHKSEPIFVTLAISAITVCFMCLIMTLIATLLFEFPGWNLVITNWLQTLVLSFPAALLWNIFYGGPLARFIFKLIFRAMLRRIWLRSPRIPNKLAKTLWMQNNTPHKRGVISYGLL